MYVIGHRGAAGLVLENTLASLKRALELGVDAVEFDIHLTSDLQPVLSHDNHLSRVGGGNNRISELTYKELRKIKLSNGEPVPHLREAMKLIGPTRAIVEIKVKDCVAIVLEVLKEFPAADAIIASPVYTEIEELKKLNTSIPGYIRVVINPFEAVQTARSYHADGLDLNFWVLNPLTYWQARRSNMQIMVYTVNSKFLAWFLHSLYPSAWICTNYPNYFTHHGQRGINKP